MPNKNGVLLCKNALICKYGYVPPEFFLPTPLMVERNICKKVDRRRKLLKKYWKIWNVFIFINYFGWYCKNFEKCASFHGQNLLFDGFRRLRTFASPGLRVHMLSSRTTYAPAGATTTLRCPLAHTFVVQQTVNDKKIVLEIPYYSVQGSF